MTATTHRSTLLLLSLLGLLAATRADGQSCATALDRATRSYDAGEFEEAKGILAPCVNELATESERWQAYRLLALVHIFLDEPHGADSAIQNLLAINPGYEPNPGRDPIEFIRPLSAFERYARFIAGLKGGGSGAARAVTSRYSIAGSPATVDDHIGIAPEIGLFAQANLTPELSLVGELLLSQRTFGRTADYDLGVRTEYTERLSYVSAPLLARFTVDGGGFRPFIYGGYVPQWLLSATSDLAAERSTATTIDDGEVVEPVSYVDNVVRSTEDRRSGMNHALAAGAGMFVDAGPGMVIADVRYEHGLSQIVLSDQRFAQLGQLYRYYQIDDDFRLRSLSFSLGYAFPLSLTTRRR